MRAYPKSRPHGKQYQHGGFVLAVIALIHPATVVISLATIAPRWASPFEGQTVQTTFTIGVPTDRTEDAIIVNPGGSETVERTAHLPRSARVKVGQTVSVVGVLRVKSYPAAVVYGWTSPRGPMCKLMVQGFLPD